MKNFKKVMTYVCIMGIALVCALNYTLFVFPNKFAPSGINGICTMIQHLTGISVGYLSLLINIPLAIWVYCKVSRSMAVRSMVYVATFSVALVLLEYVDLSQFAYSTENGTSTILGPLVAGIIYGSCYSLLIRGSANTGGMDFIAAVIHKNWPETNFFYVVFSMNTLVALTSYFVYDYRIEPVLLCIMYSFTSSMITDRLTKSGRSAIRFEIITKHPREISDAIINQLHHSATLIPGTGMYRGTPTNVLICIVNKSQIAALSAIIRATPDTFAAVSQVGEVMGNFKRLDKEGNAKVELLDTGDNLSV